MTDNTPPATGLEPIIPNKELKTLLSRAKGMSKTNQDTIWECFIYIRGTYERKVAALEQELAAARAAAMPDEVREFIKFALEWAQEDSRAIRFQMAADEHEQTMHGIDAALEWLKAQSEGGE